ncbi:transposable element Tcb2 transposase [Trichonephila clavipes]|nr:transposable element Tcb2 transposase [Trichonephila clavipes]
MALEKENLVPTVKHDGGGAMVWGCMAANGVGLLTFMDSTLNHIGCINIFKENLKQGAQDLNLGDDFWFQQDNDPKTLPIMLSSGFSTISKISCVLLHNRQI